MSSLILQQFSEKLKNPKVLTTPQEYLGPRYNEVLEFWNRIENLTQEQLRIVDERYRAFCNENRSECHKVIVVYRQVVDWEYSDNAGWAAEDVTKSNAADWATRELTGNVENPVFLKMFDNL